MQYDPVLVNHARTTVITVTIEASLHNLTDKKDW